MGEMGRMGSMFVVTTSVVIRVTWRMPSHALKGGDRVSLQTGAESQKGNCHGGSP